MAELLQALSLDRVSKRYGTATALDEVSLTVARGEFLTLLGPSGSGKTTMLMAIAGFTAPTSGEIRSTRPTGWCGGHWHSMKTMRNVIASARVSRLPADSTKRASTISPALSLSRPMTRASWWIAAST